jgi:hypothetical protein
MEPDMFRRTASAIAILSLEGMLCLTGCGNRGPLVIADFGAADRSTRSDRAQGPPDSRRPGADAGYCGATCGEDEAYLISACVRTDKIFTCAPRCDPQVPKSCPQGYRCDPWGGTPCCICEAVVPACVPEHSTGQISGPLRILPTTGTAGEPVTLSIRGAPFIVGALFFNIRMGNEVRGEEGGSGPCEIKTTFTPPNPGLYAVEVSQYGGKAPWALAGFYLASGGATAPPDVQPGFPCSMTPAPGDPTCASAAPYTCTCIEGRCGCQQP